MQRSDAYGSSNGRTACYEIGMDWSWIPHIRGLRFFVCTSVRFLSIAKMNSSFCVFLYLLTLFLSNAHFQRAPTVAARSCVFSEDLDPIVIWTSSSRPPKRKISSRVESSSAHYKMGKLKENQVLTLD